MTALPFESTPSVRRAAIEWPTIGLAISVYGGWLALTWFHEVLPWWLLVPAAAWTIAWHGSLQHEILHGHPTRNRSVNTLIGIAPLSLWLPYHRYRQMHLVHHRDERLTDPLDDPETMYWTPADWARLGPIGRTVIRLQASLLGRLLVGPAWAIGRFGWDEAKALLRGDSQRLRAWVVHGVALVPVLAWVVWACAMPFWLYALAFVYAGTALSLVRSFAEHRAAGPVDRRTAIVERAGILGLLFLHNNLHVVHHRWPSVPWYRLPALYRRHREEILTANGGLVYGGYGEVVRRFILRRHDEAIHPLGRAPMADGAPPD